MVSLSSDDFVEELHKKMRGKKEFIYHPFFASDNDYLCYKGKPLQKLNMISDYDIRDGDTLFASRRKRGGCFMVSLSILFTIVMAITLSFCTCGLSLTIIPFLLPFLAILPLFCL